MPGQQGTIELFDIPQSIADKEQMIKLCQEIDATIGNIKGFSFFGRGGTDSFTEFKKQTAQYEEALRRISELEKQLENVRSGHASNQRARTDEEIRASVKQQSETKQRTAAIKAEGDAWAQLRLKAAEANAEYRKLAAQYGENSKQAKAAREEALRYNEQIGKINEGLGQHQHKVGSYLESIKEFFSEIGTQVLSFIGILQAFDFFKDSYQEFVRATTEAVKLTNILKNLKREDALAGLKESAHKLAEEFKAYKEEDFTGVFQKLITYGKLTQGQIEDLAPVITNFAANTGQTLEASTSLILKALEGNVRGLREFGIEIQRGNTPLENFKIIMDQLKPRLEGSAKALEELDGGAKVTEVQIDELKKSIGDKLMPVMKEFFSIVRDGIEALKFYGDEIGKVGDRVSIFWKVLKGESADLKAQAALNDAHELLAKQANVNERLTKFYLEGDKFDQLSLKDQQKKIKYYEDYTESISKLLSQAISSGNKPNIERLSKELDLYKAISAQANDVVNKNKVLGLGGGNDPKDTADALAREIDARAKLLALLKDEQIARLQIIADSKDSPENQRTTALDKIFELEKEKIELVKNEQLKNTKLTESERAYIIEKANSDIFTAELKFVSDRQKIHADALEQFAADEKLTQDELKAQWEAYYKAQSDLITLTYNRSKNALSEDRDYHLKYIDEQYAKGLIKEEDYNKRKKQINDTYRIDELNAQLKQVNEERALAERKNQDLPKNQQQDLSGFDAQIANIKLQIEETANAKIFDAQKLLFDQKKKLSDQEIDMAKETADVIENVIKGSYERQINLIQKQIDKNNQLKETETANINASTLSNQEKAARIIQLDAEVAANNEALERKQRNLKRKEAEVDRIAKAASIAGTTAETVAALTAKEAEATANAALMASNPLTAAYAGVAAASAATIGAEIGLAIGLGAAQLGALFAIPLPAYEKGTDYKPKSGIALVGEKGSELVQEPSGKSYLTPDSASLMNIPQGSKIIPAHKVMDEINRDIMLSMMRANSINIREKNDAVDLKKFEEIMIKQGRETVRAIKGMKPPVVHNHIDLSFQEHIKKMS
ncbi:MAG: hypothetical protein JST87_05245 [Bacteroidetes bacterium]|nr:hypothetical protein [Bacteroidota bacterium]